MSMFKRILSLCLCLVLLGGFCAAPLQSLAAEAARSSAFAGVTGPTLVKQNGIWYYVKNGAVCNDTTLVKFNGSWWYVTGGKLASNTTTLVKFNGSWWYVVKGKVASNTTSLVKFNNEWWYVVKGKVASNTTSLVKFNNEWWYVVKGKVASATTTLVKFNNEWWYVVKGKIAANTTTLVKFNGAWYYIYKGKLAANTTTLFKYLGKWYYVEKGKINTTATTLVPFSGQWYYVKNGTTQPTATTLVKYNNSWYYVQNGVYQRSTTFCTYNGQKYYVEKGIAQTAISGKVTVNGAVYYVKNGVLTTCHSAGHSWKAATCTAPKTCTKCTVTSGSALGHNWSAGTGKCTRCGTDGITNVTLKVWSAQADTRTGWINDMEKAFEDAHPEYRITWVNGICNEGDTASVITADPEGAGDVYMFANDQIGALVEVGAIMPIGGSYLDQVKTDNSQTMINTVTYLDGKVYGFPVGNNTWFMYYNKDVFTEQDIKSLDTMLTKGKVAFPWGVGWYGGAFFLANGCSLFGAQGNDATAGIQFGGTKGYQAALKMVQLANHPNMKDGTSLYTGSLSGGTVDAYFSGSWDYASLKNAMGNKLGVAQLPTVEIGGVQKQMKSFAGSKAVGVNPNADNPQVAMMFAAFLATPAAQKSRYQKTNIIPAARSLANDAAIKSNPVAVAEINTITNASVAQPFIPEMSRYWTPMGNYGCSIADGSVTNTNYKESVDTLMMRFEDVINDTPGQDYSGTADKITVRLHYYRPDGNYTDWNLWSWDEYGITALEPPYDFVETNGEMVATVQVSPGTQKLGYIVRRGEWLEKDIEENQFIDLTGILGGSVDVYVESGVRGYEMVRGDDIVYGAHAVASSYRSVGTNGGPQLMVQMSSFDNGPVTVTVNGQTIPVTAVTAVENVVFLDLGKAIASRATYTVTYNGVSCNFTRVS